MTYYLIVWQPGPQVPEVEAYDDPAGMIARLKDLYAAARSVPVAARCRVFAFAGDRVAITGDPRTATLPDGTTVQLADREFGREDDGASILPPRLVPD